MVRAYVRKRGAIGAFYWMEFEGIRTKEQFFAGLSEEYELSHFAPGTPSVVDTTYRVRPEYYERWGSDCNDDTRLTLSDIEDLSAAWMVPLGELLAQVDANEEDTTP